MNLSNILFCLATLPFIILGSLHLLYTMSDISAPKRLVPRKLSLLSDMKNTHLGLTRETNMWQAWVGFNLSHSIGVLFYALSYLYLAVYDFGTLSDSGYIWGAPIFAAIYTFLAKKFWFRIPFIGSLLGLTLFITALATS